MREILRTGRPSPVSVLDLDWSPDGSKIAYLHADYSTGPSESDYIQRIFLVDTEGGRPLPLTDGSEQVISFSWSPDGGRIAYTVQRLVGENRLATDIHVMNADGSGVRQLTDNGWSNDPAWSPDGSHIAYVGPPERGDRLHEDIYVMRADGSEQVALTSGPARDGYPAWSPDGGEIVFSRYASRTDCSLMTASIEGGATRTLLHRDLLPGCPSDPTWQLGLQVQASPSPDPAGVEKSSLRTDVGYEFDAVTVTPSDQHEDAAVVHFRLGWARGVYPGVRRCTWDIFDQAGGLIGSKTDVFAADPSPMFGVTVFSLTGEPATAAVVCSADRLDTPGIGEVAPYPEEFKDADELQTVTSRRLDAWSKRFPVSEMSIPQIEANMEALTYALGSREGLDTWVLREVMARRVLLCRALPEGHPYRGGEYCD